MTHKVKKHFDTICASESDWMITTKPHKMPLFASSTFQFESIEQGIEIFQNQPGSHVYTRYGNPTIEAVAEKIAQLETFETNQTGLGLLCSSGMAAIHIVIQSLLESGDSIITQGNLYGGTTELFNKIFKKQKINIVISELSQIDELEKDLKSASGKLLIYLETPANPTLQCLDISEISRLAKKYEALLIVDNTFATPYLQRPIAHGADVVIHSTTKYLHGHGASTGGAIVCTDKLLYQYFWETMKLAGNNCNAFDAWLINLGLKTLTVRMDRQCKTALHLATEFGKIDRIQNINYPGLPSDSNFDIASKQMDAFGAMISFEVGKSAAEAIQFANKLKLCAIAPSLGETDSMILHPASMSHLKVPLELRLKYRITDSLIRLSVGLEHPEDILEDIFQALK